MPQTPVTIFLIVGPFIGTTSARPSAGTNEGGPLFYQATPTNTAAAPGLLPGILTAAARAALPSSNQGRHQPAPPRLQDPTSNSNQGGRFLGILARAYPQQPKKLLTRKERGWWGLTYPPPNKKNTPPPWASQLNEAAGRSLDLHSRGALLFYQATSTAAASIM